MAFAEQHELSRLQQLGLIEGETATATRRPPLYSDDSTPLSFLSLLNLFGMIELCFNLTYLLTETDRDKAFKTSLRGLEQAIFVIEESFSDSQCKGGVAAALLIKEIRNLIAENQETVAKSFNETLALAMSTIHREPLRMIVFATCLLPFIDKDLPRLRLEGAKKGENGDLREVRRQAVGYFEQFRGERSYIDAMRDLGFKWKNPLVGGAGAMPGAAAFE